MYMNQKDIKICVNYNLMDVENLLIFIMIITNMIIIIPPPYN